MLWISKGEKKFRVLKICERYLHINCWREIEKLNNLIFFYSNPLWSFSTLQSDWWVNGVYTRIYIHTVYVLSPTWWYSQHSDDYKSTKLPKYTILIVSPMRLSATPIEKRSNQTKKTKPKQIKKKQRKFPQKNSQQLSHKSCH